MALNPPSGAARTPISLLTGFLGSGKTTLLNALLKHPDLSRSLVIINEFGEIGLDHDLVAHAAEDVVVEMSSGCLCCTIRGDLVKTLREATWRFAREGRRWFDRVVIETTGLADPAPILHTLMVDPLIAARYRLDSVITTVDAANAMETLDRQIEAVKQAAVADRLLLTKTDLASGEAIAILEQRLATLNPAAPILRAVEGGIEPAEIFDAGLYNPATKNLDVQRWLNAEAYTARGHATHDHSHGFGRHHHDVNRHGDDISAICLTFEGEIHPTAFNLWLDMVTATRGPDLLRVKGIVNLMGVEGPVVIHGVQHIFHPSVTLDAWPSEDRRTRIVFIGRDLPEALLRQAFRVCTGQEQLVLEADELAAAVADGDLAAPVERRVYRCEPCP